MRCHRDLLRAGSAARDLLHTRSAVNGHCLVRSAAGTSLLPHPPPAVARSAAVAPPHRGPSSPWPYAAAAPPRCSRRAVVEGSRRGAAVVEGAHRIRALGGRGSPPSPLSTGREPRRWEWRTGHVRGTSLGVEEGPCTREAPRRRHPSFMQEGGLRVPPGVEEGRAQEREREGGGAALGLRDLGWRGRVEGRHWGSGWVTESRGEGKGVG